MEDLTTEAALRGINCDAVEAISACREVSTSEQGTISPVAIRGVNVAIVLELFVERSDLVLVR